MTALAFQPQRSVEGIVANVRGIRAWIDAEINAGRTDDEIVALAPVAIGFLNGDISIAELERRLDEAGR